MTKTTILVIAKTLETCLQLHQVLTAADYASIHATQTCLGWELIKQHQPDLIICEDNMPRSSGYWLRQKLRSDAEYGQIPFILLSSEAKSESSAQANSSITQSINQELLLKTMAQLLSQPLTRQKASY